MSIPLPDILLGLLWFQTALFDYLAILYIWQLKEYRWDRFMDYLQSKQGKDFFSSYRFLYRNILLLIVYALLKIIPFTATAVFLFIIFGIDAYINARGVLKHQIRRPIFTKKSVAIMLCIFVVERSVLFFFPSAHVIFLQLLFRFITASFIVFLFLVPTRFLKWLSIYRATKKISKFPNLAVIGITGSYGKTSIKEFTAHILSKKFRVLKTPQNTNTDIGVAKFILKTDFKGVDVFVVEMGAYKRGEIKRICSIVKPKIGILSAINEQHLALFGSIEQIQKTKYELLRAIPADGLVVTNADNTYCMEYVQELNCKKIRTFGTDPENNPDCLIKNIEVTENGIECDGAYKEVEAHLFAPILGAHQATNIAAAIISAVHLKMTKEEIVDAIKTLKNESETALKKYSYGKCIIVDDSYNSNPDGFSAALAILNNFSSSLKRIVITRGMVELGEKSEELHKKIAEEIAFCADQLIVINPDFIDYFKESVKDLHGKFKLDIESIFEEEKLLEYVKNLKNTESVILLESRIPSLVYKEISGKNT